MFSKDVSFREIPCLAKETGRGASILCRCFFGKTLEGLEHSCKIDTGAALTVIPRVIWEQEFLKEYVENLPKADPPYAGIGGQPIRTHVGTAPIGVLGNMDDKEYQRLQKIAPRQADDYYGQHLLFLGECKVLFRMDGQPGAGAPDVDQLDKAYVLLGLGGNTLKKGGLCINWSGKQPQAHLIERKQESI